jgi:DNA-binding beta-propeller fold protein YncE
MRKPRKFLDVSGVDLSAVNATDRAHIPAMRVYSGGSWMKLRTIWTCTLAALIAASLAAGCGSKGTANTVTVAVTSSIGSNIIVGQATTLTATVTGGTTTNTAVNWQPCQFTTTTVSGTTTTTSTPANCPSDGSLGTLSNQQTTGTATYTAPGSIPDQTKFPGLQIIITAQSQQDTKKTGSIKLTLNSGIGLSLNPVTATVATNEPQKFTVVATNDLQNLGVNWLLTQSSPTATVTEPNLTTCSPACGTLSSANTASGVPVTYTAPSTVPTASTPAGASTTPANVTIVATAKADNTRFVTGTISIVQGGPITFNGISPTIAPQGGVLWDIYLDAPNITSASSITITSSNGGGSRTFSSSDVPNQIKVLLPIPNATTSTPGSIGARLRLLEGDLGPVASSSAPLTYTVSVTDPGQPVTQGAGPFIFTLMPVRPTLVASSPTGLVQGAPAGVPVVVDGGYFGPGGTFATASSAAVQTSPIPKDPSSNARRLVLDFPASSGAPGLYPISLSRTSSPLPSPNNSAVTTISVFPGYSGSLGVLPTPTTSVAAGTNPSAIDIDPTLGIAVVAETGSNAVQFYTIGAGSLTPSGAPIPVGTTPTGVSVNPNTHCVAVVNYISQNVSIVPIPNSSCPFTSVTNIDLSNAFQGQVNPAPRPYAIGVDPDTNLALVAFSSTSTTSGANLGFVVNLNQGAGAFGCLAGQPVQTPPCIFSQVSLNTGQYPQVAVDPHGHRAYVTPGGSGIVSGIDVTQPSTSIALSSLVYNAGTVIATTANSTPLTGLVPGIPTTVLISGVPSVANSSNSTPATLNLNGVFSISVTSSTTFQYFLGANMTGSATANGGTVFFGEPNLVFGGLSNTTQGIAINPISHTAALADANAVNQQINLLNQLDQSFSSISFQTNCTAFTVPCTTSGEFPGTARVAWQPFTNSIVSYNPGVPGTPVNQLSISDPVTQKRYGLVTMPANTTGSANISVQNGTTGSLTLWGGVAVDTANNQAFVVQSGTGAIQIVPLSTTPSNAQKPTEITEVIVEPSPGVIGGIPNAFVPEATLTSTSTAATVKIFGSGFVSGAQVLLDGVDITSTTPAGAVSVPSSALGREIDATIPAVPFLSMPHDFALQVLSNGFMSNAVDFIVVKAVDMRTACTTPNPSSVAIADQIANGPFSPIAVVTNNGCNSLSVIDINPVPGSMTFGTVLNSVSIGGGPQGVAVNSRLGMAVVANNAAGTASIVNLAKTPPVEAVPDVTVGSSPIGVAINEATGVALVANFGSNSVSQINLALLFGSSPATTLTAATINGVQSPIAVAIDPDRGTNNQGLAEVTGLQLTNSGQVGALYPVDIGLATPTLSTTVSVGAVTSTPNGIVFNPAVPGGAAPAAPPGVPAIVTTNTSNSGLFYVNSSGGNVITSFNPDNAQPTQTRVGINPTALAVNPQSGAILTSNFGGKSASIVDTVTNPKTVNTLGLPGSAQFGVAIDQLTNLAVIVDSANNRVLLFPMPH